jgi:hypothetical protein
MSELEPNRLTLDDKGKVLVEHYDGFDYPPELTFECINNFIHSQGRQYEELQYLCLGLITELEKQRKLET